MLAKISELIESMSSIYISRAKTDNLIIESPIKKDNERTEHSDDTEAT